MVRKLEAREWGDYLHRVSRAIEGNRIDADLSGPGERHRDARLYGLTYEADDNVVTLTDGGAGQVIRGPREIYVDDEADGLHGMDIVDGDGLRCSVHLKEPLELPPPQQGTAPDFGEGGEPT